MEKLFSGASLGQKQFFLPAANATGSAIKIDADQVERFPATKIGGSIPLVFDLLQRRGCTLIQFELKEIDILVEFNRRINAAAVRVFFRAYA